jgi:hypothetical protein
MGLDKFFGGRQKKQADEKSAPAAEAGKMNRREFLIGLGAAGGVAVAGGVLGTIAVKDTIENTREDVGEIIHKGREPWTRPAFGPQG